MFTMKDLAFLLCPTLRDLKELKEGKVWREEENNLAVGKEKSQQTLSRSDSQELLGEFDLDKQTLEGSERVFSDMYRKKTLPIGSLVGSVTAAAASSAALFSQRHYFPEELSNLTEDVEIEKLIIVAVIYMAYLLGSALGRVMGDAIAQQLAKHDMAHNNGPTSERLQAEEKRPLVLK